MPPLSSVVLVTGCTQGGIGFALCEEFASKGCKVYATARRIEALDGFKHEGIEKLVLDVNDDANMGRVVKTIIDTHGRIDIVVNNAGGICPGPILDVPMDRVRQTFETNTFSIVRMAQYVVPHMVEHGSGLIINIGSVVGEIATPWNGIYSGTKGALHMITDCLALECKMLNENIKVMLVITGAVQSNIANNAIVELPEKSLYKSFIDLIIKRANLSQSSGTVSAAKYSQAVVAKALSRNPPLHFIYGGLIKSFSIGRLLPRTWVFWYLFRLWGGGRK